MRTIGTCRSLFTICVVSDSTVRRSLSERPSSRPSAFASSPERMLSARSRSDAIAGTTSQRRLPVSEAARLVRDDRLGPLRLAPPPAQALADDCLEIVDVVQVAVVEIGHGGVDVARDGEVDHEQRPALAIRASVHWTRRRPASSSTTRRRPLARARHPTGRTERPDPRSASASCTARSCVRLVTAADRRAPLRRGSGLRARSPHRRRRAARGSRRARRRPAARAPPRPRRRTDGLSAIAVSVQDLLPGVERLPEEPVENGPAGARLVRGRAPARGSRPRRERASRGRPRRGTGGARPSSSRRR